jgi:hypothetical protein
MYIGLEVQIHGIQPDHSRSRSAQAEEVRSAVHQVLAKAFPILDDNDIIVTLEEYTEKPASNEQSI